MPPRYEPPLQQLDLGPYRMAYVDAGAGPAVVLVHGSPVSSWSFRHQIPALAEHFRVVAPDLLGFGASGAPPFGADFGEQATALGRLLEHLDLGPLRLVVHDWGGPIALGCAARRQLPLEQLVLMNTTFAPDFRPPPYWRPFVGPLLGDLLVVHLNAVAHGLPLLLRAAQRREIRRRYAGVLAQPRSRRSVLALERLSGYRRLTEPVAAWLERAPAPTLLLWGQPDPYFRQDELDRLRRHLPHSELRLLPGAGHFPQEDAPAAVTAALLDFLE